MKMKLATTFIGVFAATSAFGSGLYYVPNDTENSIPVVWTVGIDAVWDDNTTPGGTNNGDETFSLNPYVGVSFVNVTPQTTVDVYARLGVIYYLDEPNAVGSDDTYGQARAGVNVTHRFNERLRLISRNFLSYELEPDYSYGFASSRQISEYIYWLTDNSIGYRWTERFATYSGFQLTGLEFDNVANADRFTWSLYNQFRYQLSPQSVLTASYRYSETEGDNSVSDTTNQYLLVGIEHRFSPNTILILGAGAQFREIDRAGGSDSTNPYLEASVRSNVNTQFSVRAFVRYGVEDYDTVVAVGAPAAFIEYQERLTLRVGVSGEYQLSPSLSFFGGVNLINTSYEGARNLGLGGAAGTPDADETLFNLYVGASLKFTEYLYGTLTYNFTDSDSDVNDRTFNRNRVSMGLRAEF